MDFYFIESSEEFIVEYQSITAIIYYVYGNPSSAKVFADEVANTINSLSTFPMRYQIVKGDIRRVRVKNYHIYYSIDEQMKIVNILHILYQGMDITQIANWN